MSKLPSQREIKRPLFQHIASNIEGVSLNQAYEFVSEHFNVNPRDTEHWHNRIRWACRALRADGLVARSPRGLWRVTPETEDRIHTLIGVLVP